MKELANIHGALFEKHTNLQLMLAKAGFIFDDSYFASQRKFKKYILNHYNVHTEDFWSRQLLPDEAFFYQNTMYIIEKKWQEVEGSVDEKLQTCDFKLKQYTKIAIACGLKVKYAYLLNDWFKQDKYKDVLNYIKNDAHAEYFFNEIPLSFFELQ